MTPEDLLYLDLRGLYAPEPTDTDWTIALQRIESTLDAECARRRTGRRPRWSVRVVVVAALLAVVAGSVYAAPRIVALFDRDAGVEPNVGALREPGSSMTTDEYATARELASAATPARVLAPRARSRVVLEAPRIAIVPTADDRATCYVARPARDGQPHTGCEELGALGLTVSVLQPTHGSAQVIFGFAVDAVAALEVVRSDGQVDAVTIEGNGYAWTAPSDTVAARELRVTLAGEPGASTIPVPAPPVT